MLHSRFVRAVFCLRTPTGNDGTVVFCWHSGISRVNVIGGVLCGRKQSFCYERVYGWLMSTVQYSTGTTLKALPRRYEKHFVNLRLPRCAFSILFYFLFLSFHKSLSTFLSFSPFFSTHHLSYFSPILDSDLSLERFVASSFFLSYFRNDGFPTWLI